MGYTDYDMKVAAEIAYVNFNPMAVELHPEWTIREHIENSPEFAKYMQDEKADLYNTIMDSNSEYGNWKIVDYRNQNDDDGFCGCLIETGDNNAIIGYRGSEFGDSKSPLDSKIINDDWNYADAGLLNSSLTQQQESAQNYMSYIESKYGGEYDKFSVSGHSLGGGLASHAVLTASDSMASKFERVVSLDGPGVSQEYLDKYAKEIEKNAYLIEHYQYSLVGCAIKEIPGSTYRCISSDGGNIPILNLLLKHCLENIQFDENGNFISSTPDSAALWFKGFTNAMDDNTTQVGLWSALELISIVCNPLGLIDFKIDMYKEIFEYAFTKAKEYVEEKVRQYAQSRMAEFSADPVLLSGQIGTLKTISSDFGSESTDVLDVSSQISMLLKTASLFTLSYKLKKSASNLSKFSKKSLDMSNAVSEISQILKMTENNILSYDGV